MINRQDQNVSDNGIAAQANRDIIINNSGLSLSDVRELVGIFLDRHLTELREEAAAIARLNAGEFLEEFVKKAI